MDALSKSQKDEYATAFAILALYDGGAEVTSEQITNMLEATGNTEVEPFYPIIYANFLSDPKKIGEMIASPGVGGGALSM
jgi:large subunit ribosomal protein LP1